MRSSSGICCLAVLVLAVLPAQVRADGGTVLASLRSSPFVITVFTSPALLETGPADMTLLVQDARTLAPVLDAAVSLTLRSPSGAEVRAFALRPQSGNRLLYAASVEISQPGRWILSAEVERSDARAGLTTEFGVAPARRKAPAAAVHAALPAGLALLYIGNRILARRPRRHDG